MTPPDEALVRPTPLGSCRQPCPVEACTELATCSMICSNHATAPPFVESVDKYLPSTTISSKHATCSMKCEEKEQ